MKEMKKISIFVLALLVNLAQSDNDMKIELKKWSGNDKLALMNLDEAENEIQVNGSTYVVNANVNVLQFECSAPYPVQWRFTKTSVYTYHQIVNFY